MKKLSAILTLCVFTLVLSNPAQARLGDTEKDLIARFGLPKARSSHSIHAQGKFIELGPTLYFKQDDWSIHCDLIANRVHRISYGKPGEWTEEQVQIVLGSNSQGTAWTETSKPAAAKFNRTWKRADASTAVWSKGSGMTFVWDAYQKAKAAVEHRAKAEASRKPKI